MSAGTSTRGCASSPRDSSTRSCWRAAGLARLGRAADGILDELVPAAGQGALALEARRGRPRRGSRALSRPGRVGVRRRRARARTRARGVVQHPGRCATPVRSAMTPRARAARVGRASRRLGVAERSAARAGRPRRARVACGGAAARGGRGRDSCARPSGSRSRDRLPRRRRPGRSRAADRPRARADRSADVIVYDRLIPAAALDGAREPTPS